MTDIFSIEEKEAYLYKKGTKVRTHYKNGCKRTMRGLAVQQYIKEEI